MRREIILQRFSVTQLNTATNVSSFHFACIRGHLLCFSIDSGQIFLNKSFRKSLWLQSRPYAGDSWHPPCMSKSISRTGRCLASHTCNKRTTYDKIFTSMLRTIINLFMKSNNCWKIAMDALDYKGLKSEMIDNSTNWELRFRRLRGLGRGVQCMPVDRESLINLFN